MSAAERPAPAWRDGEGMPPRPAIAPASAAATVREDHDIALTQARRKVQDSQKQIRSKLKVYAGPNHPHAGQVNAGSGKKKEEGQ